MSIKSQIERIKSNVDNSLLEVQAKGVAVPDDANSDNLPGLIAQITGGAAEVEEVTNAAGGKTVYINSENDEKLPELPEGFTRLKWIQSDGRQYVNTKIKATTNNFRVTMKFEYTSVAAQQSVFGTTPGGSVHGVCPYTHAAGVTSIYLGTSAQLLPTTVSVNEVYEWDIAAENGLLTWWQNGATKTATYSGTPDQTLNYFLFANNNNGNPNRFCSAKIYFAQAYNDGTISRNYIPCLNASGEAGLWDTVTQAFFGDAAGVGFIAGPVVLDYTLPEGYEELAWIESDGRQYVDAGIVISAANISGFRAIANIEIVAQSGWRLDGSGGSAPYATFGVSTDGYITYGTGDSYTKSGTAYEQGRYEWDYNLLDGYISLDGQKIADITLGAIGANSRNYLISGYARTSTPTLYAGKFHSYQIYDNGTLARYYVPCRTNTGEVGLWDAVNSVFYGDAAGVGFISGPKKGVSKVVLEDEVLIDLTGDTISPETVLAGFIGHGADGAQFVGELVQKAGGRPVARGTITTSSTTATISGLAFAPEWLFMSRVSKPQNSQSLQTDVVYDAANAIKINIYAMFNSYYGTQDYGRGNPTVTVTDSSITVKTNSPNFSGSYNWWAIGAEG